MITLSAHEANILKKFITQYYCGHTVETTRVKKEFPGDLPVFEKLSELRILFHHDWSSMSDGDEITYWGEGYTVTLPGMLVYCNYFNIDPLSIKFSHPYDQKCWVEMNSGSISKNKTG